MFVTFSVRTHSFDVQLYVCIAFVLQPEWLVSIEDWLILSSSWSYNWRYSYHVNSLARNCVRHDLLVFLQRCMLHSATFHLCHASLSSTVHCFCLLSVKSTGKELRIGYYFCETKNRTEKNDWLLTRYELRFSKNGLKYQLIREYINIGRKTGTVTCRSVSYLLNHWSGLKKINILLAESDWCLESFQFYWLSE